MVIRSRITLYISFVVCAAVLMAAPFLYIYFKEHRVLNLMNTSPVNPPVTGKVAERVIEAVAKAEKIPKDEPPTVVWVTDTTTLSSFGQIRRGDYILLYQRAGLAVVYDETTTRIVNAVPVNIKNQNAKQ